MASSFSVNCPKASFTPHPNPKLNPNHRNTTSIVLFQSDFKSTRALVAAGSSSLQSSKRGQNDLTRVPAQLNETALEKSLNSAPSKKSDESTKISSPDTAVPDAASITAFMNQVAELVQLVDSRDIVELELKQQNCEVVIRKKEALPQPPAGPMAMMQSPQPQAVYQSLPPPPQSAPASGPTPTAPAQAPPSPIPAKPKSSLPPLKSPMAGTFYRSPAPGAPPFAKVGDKVQKGQVICIIEAMKLMNEIEADQSGTIVDILAEDGKPVSLDTPLLVIEP
ncbi:biotin carboxyl carrier protein of acetyl-CoA carboxylase, chloroplastic-like [Bidens hawaiensis]|uniref:biotin carboxyl carrier protein of acetyl-CoA carboxylase, chloroplastic-like n=1 Tax=Bidens hawaiensis TaxID=980011 RepID=UPI00404B44ED